MLLLAGRVMRAEAATPPGWLGAVLPHKHREMGYAIIRQPIASLRQWLRTLECPDLNLTRFEDLKIRLKYVYSNAFG
jgi:hypothetical protein